MKVSISILSLVVSMGMGLVSVQSFAADGVISQDQQRVNQDRSDLKKDNQDIKTAESNIQKDKSAGNQQQLVIDKKALKEARRNKRNDKARLAQDQGEKKHDTSVQ